MSQWEPSELDSLLMLDGEDLIWALYRALVQAAPSEVTRIEAEHIELFALMRRLGGGR